MRALPTIAAPIPMATPSHIWRCLEPAQAEDTTKDNPKIVVSIIIKTFFFFIFLSPIILVFKILDAACWKKFTQNFDFFGYGGEGLWGFKALNLIVFTYTWFYKIGKWVPTRTTLSTPWACTITNLFRKILIHPYKKCTSSH